MVIVSHSLSAIFVKTPKTAGTSIELALSACCGDRDIITPNSIEDELIRSSIGGRGPQNIRMDYRVAEVLVGGPSIWAQALRNRSFRIRKCKFKTHDSAAAIRARIGRKAWNRYFSFAVERNPWDRAVSAYFWSTRATHERLRPPFTTWLELQKDNLSNFPLYSDGSAIIVDELVPFEALSSRLPQIWARLGIRPPDLPRAKSGFRPADSHYTEFFTIADRDLVSRACAREIRELGYEF